MLNLKVLRLLLLVVDQLLDTLICLYHIIHFVATRVESLTCAMLLNEIGCRQALRL